MKLCYVCNKNVATIYTAKVENGKTEIVGLCVECAKKMGIPVVDQLIQQSGLTPEELGNISQQMGDILQDADTGDGEGNNFLASLMNSALTQDQKMDSPDESRSDSGEQENSDDGSGRPETKTKKDGKRAKKKYLDTYGTNLTAKAMNNEVDRVIGRDREIDRVIQILNRRAKNNPVLIGEPGVGKTAIAEGLAVRIVEKQVPAKLYDYEVYLLDLTSVVAGTQFRGQFESRMKSIIDEAKKYGNVILVIDEVHNIIGAGDAQGGALNAANILKPALANGDIQVIGTTTLDEYRKYIEKDSALERRFQPVIVDEPTIDETVEILKGIRKYYEDYHRVKISDEVIEAAVNLSERYINDRYLPDKAIDVIDEASSRANLKNQGLVELKSLKDKLVNVRSEMQVAANSTDYEKAARCKADECKIEQKIDMIEKDCGEVALTVEDVAYVIEAWTKVPVHRITEEETDRLKSLEKRLHRRVIGQNEAIGAVSRAIRRNRLGFRKKRKPSSFIFVGPTGVGKTELVKALACELFGSEDALIRIDMSEYMEKYTVSKLIGAPPGYVGYDEGGQLTEKVRRKPYSVILLDEIEKAHPDVFNMLLQILEDGRLTDSQGRTVYFDNTVIIMTSNAGTDFKGSGIGFTGSGYETLQSHTMDALKETFRPEFLNRIDDIIVFNKLSKEELHSIVELMLKEVSGEIAEKKMTMEVSEEAKEFLLRKGYDEKYGARPLRRAIQRYVEDEITEQYLDGRFANGSHIKVGCADGKIVLN